MLCRGMILQATAAFYGNEREPADEAILYMCQGGSYRIRIPDVNSSKAFPWKTFGTGFEEHPSCSSDLGVVHGNRDGMREVVLVAQS